MRTAAVRLIALFAVLVTVIVLGSPTATSATSPTARAHFITNLHGSTAPAALGFDVFDTSESGLAALPSGVRGLVWLGQKCPTPADARFKAAIDRMSKNPKVFGYYLSDEPHIADCPGGAAALASRADYVRAKNANQWTFIVLSRQADVYSFRPAVSHVHLVGFDPYPCSTANPTCDLRKIGERVGWADAAGIERWRVVPVFPTFGQEKLASHYYNLPNGSQLQAILDEWRTYAPYPVMDYSYTWGHQSSSNPTLIDSASLQSVMKKHNVVG
jgi:hypothetical protein